MLLCNHTISKELPPCKSFNGGIKSVELSTMDCFIEYNPKNFGGNIQFYFRRKNKLYFKQPNGDKFILVFPIDTMKIPKIRYGQWFRLKENY